MPCNEAYSNGFIYLFIFFFFIICNSLEQCLQNKLKSSALVVLSKSSQETAKINEIIHLCIYIYINMFIPFFN